MNRYRLHLQVASSDEDCGIHYSDDEVINNDGDIGEQLQVSNVGEEQYGSCESTNATIICDESLEGGNNITGRSCTRVYC